MRRRSRASSRAPTTAPPRTLRRATPRSARQPSWPRRDPSVLSAAFSGGSSHDAALFLGALALITVPQSPPPSCGGGSSGR